MGATLFSALIKRLFFLAILFGAAFPTIEAQQATQSCEKLGDGLLLGVVPPERIPPILHPKFVTAQEAEQFMKADEPVLGVFDGQTADRKSVV